MKKKLYKEKIKKKKNIYIYIYILLNSFPSKPGNSKFSLKYSNFFTTTLSMTCIDHFCFNNKMIDDLSILNRYNRYIDLYIDLSLFPFLNFY